MRRWLSSWIAAVLFVLAVPSLHAQAGQITAFLTTTTCPGSGCVALGVQGQAGVSVQVTGTFTGTLTFESSLDGVTYVATSMTPAGSTSQVTTATAAGMWGAAVGGVAQYRVRFSSYTSGTAKVTIGSALGIGLGGLNNGGGGGGGGAPTDATYVLNTANGSLANAQDLSALTTGLAVVTNGTGLVSTVGDPLAVAHGGTGLASGTSGGILGFTGSTTLASSVLLTNHAIVLGAGAGATPTPLGSLGTTTTLLHGNAAGAPTFSAVDVTADITGVVPVANGGTGLSSGTSGGVLAFTASGTIASSGALTANRLVLGGGAGVAPTVAGSLGTTTTLLHGNAAGAPTFGAVSLTADVSGTLPFANGGTNVATAADDTTLISSGSAWVATTINDCTGTGKAITYIQASNSFGCNTISGGSPAGSDTQVQFNSSGSFGASAFFTVNTDATTPDFFVGSTTNSNARVLLFDSATGTTPASDGGGLQIVGTDLYLLNNESGSLFVYMNGGTKWTFAGADLTATSNGGIGALGFLRSDTTTAHTLLFQARDVDDSTFRTFITFTNGNTPDATMAAPSGGTMTLQPSTYKSADGSTGVTVSACTSFKNGLCVAGS